MNDRLLSAWFKSPLADDPDCHLIFVGLNAPGAYGEELERRIRASSSAGRIKITGWADQTSYRHWLAAADVGVQLRTLSRGETSASVLDCMNAGLATIVNANGSMAELDPDAVWLMPDNFSDDDLIEALSTVYADATRRRDMGDRARARIADHNSPRDCAAAYASAVEAFYARAQVGQSGLEEALSQFSRTLTEDDWLSVVKAMGRNAPPKLRRKRLMVDISNLIQQGTDLEVQHVARSILHQWLKTPPNGYIVEPIYTTSSGSSYSYARKFISEILGIPQDWSKDELVEPVSGDILVSLDFNSVIVPQQSALLQEWRRMGVTVRFVIYDLLPVIAPEYFFSGARPDYHAWLETISQFDGVICISRTVADEYRDWLDHYGPTRITPLKIDWFHLGGAAEKQISESGEISAEAKEILYKLRSTPSFLSVATIEPRKGYQQTLDAMERLWASGTNVNFVIVGKPGWMMDDFIDRLRTHPEVGNRLFWLEGINDDYLSAVYGACRYLISASQAEGFGLPLIEAARHGLPVLARDIPVFREVAGDAATYFPDSRDPAVLAQAIESLLEPEMGAVKPLQMKWLTWQQSADALLARVMRTEATYLEWMPDGVHRFWGSDHRLRSNVGRRDGTLIRTTGNAGFLVFGPYTPLDAGHWLIEARGDVACLDGSEFIDIVSDAASKVHFSAPLSRTGDQWVVEGEYKLAEQTEAVEVRLWVSDVSNLSLTGFSLERLSHS